MESKTGRRFELGEVREEELAKRLYERLDNADPQTTESVDWCSLTEWERAIYRDAIRTILAELRQIFQGCPT